MNYTVEMSNVHKWRNHFIDILKGLCIIFIIITHSSFSGEARLKYLFPFWIDMAVPIFMIISGYVYSCSYKTNKITNFCNAYCAKNVGNKMIRYTIPFSIVWIIEELCYVLLRGEYLSSMSVIRFLRGGVGPGSYYYCIMMQFIFVFPLIFFIVDLYKGKGVLICGVANAFYELLKWAYGMNEECYRFLIFRYILLIAVGCFIASSGFKNNILASIISCLVGIGFIISYHYLGYSPVIVTYWTKTCFIACLYIIPIIMLLITKLRNLKCKILEVFGRASYNIFLTQMVWFAFAKEKISVLIQNRFLYVFVNLFICLGVGVVFYLVETPITKWIIKRYEKFIDRC